MQHIQIDRFGGPQVLGLTEAPERRAPPDGYVVEIHAAGVNFADTVERRGTYKRDQYLPAVLGKEAAGVVIEAGPDALEFAPGDRVIVISFRNGCYAERVAVHPHEVLPAPPGYSFPEMAAFGTSFATAWFALNEIGRVRQGDSVLIQAAAGGVGTAAVALARSLGCAPVIGTAGGPFKGAVAREMGADVCIDYTRSDGSDIADLVFDVTHDRGVDFCLESVGGPMYEASLELLAPLGRLVIIGFSSLRSDYADAIKRLHPLTVFHRSISVGGLNIDNLAFQRRRDVWQDLLAHVTEHGLRPRVGLYLPWDQVGEAHALLESRATTGKVVLAVHPDEIASVEAAPRVAVDVPA